MNKHQKFQFAFICCLLLADKVVKAPSSCTGLKLYKIQYGSGIMDDTPNGVGFYRDVIIPPNEQESSRIFNYDAFSEFPECSNFWLVNEYADLVNGKKFRDIPGLQAIGFWCSGGATTLDVLNNGIFTKYDNSFNRTMIIRCDVDTKFRLLQPVLPMNMTIKALICNTMAAHYGECNVQ